MELLPEGGDVEEKLLLRCPGGKHLPPHALLVSGREQVRQVVPMRVGAEGSDQAVFLQPAPQLFCKNNTMTPLISQQKQEVKMFSSH